MKNRFTFDWLSVPNAIYIYSINFVWFGLVWFRLIFCCYLYDDYRSENCYFLQKYSCLFFRFFFVFKFKAFIDWSPKSRNVYTWDSWTWFTHFGRSVDRPSESISHVRSSLVFVINSVLTIVIIIIRNVERHIECEHLVLCVVPVTGCRCVW